LKNLFFGILVALVLTMTMIPAVIVSAEEIPPLDHVILSPINVTLPTEGTQQFTAIGQDSANATVTGVNYTWSVIAGGGTISPLGSFTASDTAGTSTIQVVATKDIITRTATATVTVVVPGPLDHVALAPNTVTIAVNGTQQFTAIGQDLLNVPATDVSYEWSVISGTGTISTSGLYTAAATPGTNTVKVIATKDTITKSDTATVTVVVPGTLDHVILTPAMVNLGFGETQQFTAISQDFANITVTDVSYTWTITAGSGTISNSGLFTASGMVGTSTVEVTATQGAIVESTTAIITVVQWEDDEDRCEPCGWAHGKKLGWHGEKTPPGWSKGNKTGWAGEVCPPGLMKAK